MCQEQDLNFLYKIFYSSILVFTFCPAALAVTPGLDLTIEMTDFPRQEIIKKKKIRFKKACAKFGTYLSNNRGLWGSGPFKKVTCKSSASGKGVKTPWLLKVSGDSSVKVFEIFYREKAGKDSLQARYSLQTEVGPLVLMGKENSKLIAFYLTSSLPFRSVLPPDLKPGSGQAGLKGRSVSLKNMNPPSTLEVFSIDRVGDLWRADSKGRLTFKEENGKTAEWVLSELKQNSGDGDVLFVAQIENNAETLQAVDRMIRNSSETFFEKFLNFGRSAYVGGRYGVPLKGQGVMKNAPLIGLFGEFRSGFLSGLRLNYDLIPKQQVSDSNGSTSFTWSRLQLAYSFSKIFSGKIINSFDVTPRLGVANLNYEYAPSATSDTTAYSFKLNRAPTVGLEVGAEKATNLFRVRAWSFGSFSVGVLPLDKNYTTTSLRVGLDLYREFISFRMIKLAVLGFTAFESTKIEKKLTDEQKASDATLVSQLQLNSSFLGGGLTLTW
jgi:hypothetical protein